MIHTSMSMRGMVTAPHHLAAQAGLAVLRDGGNAIEAVIAAAAASAVVYPHMNGLGGDAFWLISEPGRPPLSIDGAGGAGSLATPDLYRQAELDAIPGRGPLAAITVAGAVSSWLAALEISARWGGRAPLPRLFEDAIHYARNGFPITGNQHDTTVKDFADLHAQPGFAEHFLVNGEVPKPGHVLVQPALAETFEKLALNGLDDFYRGAIGRAVASDLAKAGCPIASGDLARHRSIRRRPLSLNIAGGHLYNTPPPTQGLASLMILGLFDRLGIAAADGFDHIHGLVEATKQAYLVRDSHVTDPSHMQVHPATYLSEHLIDRLAANISPRQAMPWPKAKPHGDTVWIGAVDAQGHAVSFIQSLYHGFGSGVVLPETGLTWHNRGAALSLDPNSKDFLKAHRKPFHTLSPALARLKDGRIMVYGSMGGEGQPQTQAIVYTRHVTFGQDLQAAITAPRWVLGRNWGASCPDLRMENRFDAGIVTALRKAGHPVTLVEPFDSLMGHAGALVRHPDGRLEGAADPRGDGVVAGF